MLSSLAASFRSLHQASRPLVLPNVWDAASARLVEDAGADAIATTSSGVSWAHGRRDGQGLSRDEMMAAVRRIVQAVERPVTADIEGGYGKGTPADVAGTVRAVLDAGAVGVNLEDSPGLDGAPLVDVSRQCDRLRAARDAASRERCFINARVDVFLVAAGEPAQRLDATLERAARYLDAGADGIFVPGVVDATTIRALADGIEAPLNVMAGPDAPPVEALAALGVSRVSVGPRIAQAAYARVQACAAEVLSSGTYHAFETTLTFGDLDGRFPDA